MICYSYLPAIRRSRRFRIVVLQNSGMCAIFFSGVSPHSLSSGRHTLYGNFIHAPNTPRVMTWCERSVGQGDRQGRCRPDFLLTSPHIGPIHRIDYEDGDLLDIVAAGARGVGNSNFCHCFYLHSHALRSRCVVENNQFCRTDSRDNVCCKLFDWHDLFIGPGSSRTISRVGQ